MNFIHKYTGLSTVSIFRFLFIVAFVFASTEYAPRVLAFTDVELSTSVSGGVITVDVSPFPHRSTNGVFHFETGNGVYPGAVVLTNTANSFYYSGGHVCVNSIATDPQCEWQNLVTIWGSSGSNGVHKKLLMLRG